MRINSINSSSRLRHLGFTQFNHQRSITYLPRYGARFSCRVHVKRKRTLNLKVRLRYRTIDLKIVSLATGLPYYKGYPQLSAEFTYGWD